MHPLLRSTYRVAILMALHGAVAEDSPASVRPSRPEEMAGADRRSTQEKAGPQETSEGQRKAQEKALPERPPASKGPAAAEAKGASEAVEVRLEGARLQYTTAEIPRTRRAARGELDAIESASGVLFLDKAIRFRRAGLRPGEYAMKVEVEAGKTWHLAISPMDAEEDEDGEVEGEASAETRGERTRAKGVLRRARAAKKEIEVKEAQGAAETPTARDAEETKDAKDVKDAGDSKETKETGGAKPGRRANNPQVANARNEEQGNKAPPSLRVPLTLAPLEEGGSSVVMDLEAVGKAPKISGFKIIVRAGKTEARTGILRFDEK